ncbi:MAG: ATP-binding protein [Thermoguttaceae bacterium]|jgi:two-component system phosphate regulon sensor histidine kinase PhoR
MRKRRLLWQLFFAYFWITLIAMVGVVLYASQKVHELYVAEADWRLETAARTCEARLGDLLDGGQGPLQARCDELARTLDARVTVILSSGRVIADSAEEPRQMENHNDRDEVAAAMGGSIGRATRYSTTLKQDLRYAALPILRDGRVAGAVRTAMPLRKLTQPLDAAYLQIAGAGLAVAALLALASFLASRRIVRPLEEIRHGAERFARGELKHRLPDSDSEEIGMLAESLNRMAEQLDERIHTVLSQQNEHEAVLSSMEEGVLAVDRGGTVLSINQTGAALLGAEAEQLRGRSVYEVIRKPDLLKFIETSLGSPTSIDGDLRFYGPEERWLNAHGTVLHDPQGHKIGVLVVLHDFTRLRHLENVRRDFVANVSHELRTPITSIKGFVETLLDEELDDKPNALRFLGIVLRQVNRLDAIINDLLLLSRIERGAEDQTIETGPEPLAEVLAAAAEMCEQKATAKSISVTVHCPEDLVARLNGPLVEQAVSNLIDNAIKYSGAESQIQVEARREPGGIVIRVQDHGCGIAANHLPRLFERFYRVDKARSRELGGTGLGLAIVKHIVTAHQGTVEVESTLGVGSTFSIRLPG